MLFLNIPSRSKSLRRTKLISTSSHLAQISIRRIFYLIFGLSLCSNAQVIYDSPPVGVSLTRPVLPWLARYFVSAGDRKVYFLDEPQRGPATEEVQMEGGGGQTQGGDGQGQGGGGAAGMAGNQQNGPPPTNNANQGGPNGNENGMENNPIPPIPPILQLTEQQKSQLKQLQYTVPVPVPVISAPVNPVKFLAEPCIPSAPPPIQYPMMEPQGPVCLPPQPFPMPLPAPIAPIPGAIPAAAVPAVPAPNPPPIPLGPFPVPFAPAFIAAPPAPLPEPQPIVAESVQMPPPQTVIDPYAPLATLPSAPPPPAAYSAPVTFLNTAPLLINGSPKPSNPNFSFRDAVLTGAAPPNAQQPPPKFMQRWATMTRRFNGYG